MKIGITPEVYTVFKDTDDEFTGTLKEISEHFDINYSTLFTRLQKNHYNLEKVIKFGKYMYAFTVFKGTDREFTGTYTQIAKHFGIRYNAFMMRLQKNNYNLEEAIDFKPKYNNKGRVPTTYTVFKDTNKEFTGTINDIANHFNINYNTFISRLRRNNKNFEDAIDFISNQGKKKE